MSPWIKAARLRTLPLAISGILLGSALAKMHGAFDLQVFAFGLITAILLQVLSNYANDYGDFKKGTDQAAHRTDRMMAAGLVTVKQMHVALLVVSLTAFISGLLLLYFSKNIQSTGFQLMLILGFIAIAAAIKYTVGKGAYAYRGWGDLFVFVFFGLVSVGGIFYLHSGNVTPVEVWMAAAGCGLLSAGVLNVNNIRDIDSDEKSGKITVPVRLGFKKALIYHRLLLWLGFSLVAFSFLLYNYLTFAVSLKSMEYLLMLAVFSPVLILFSAHISRLKNIVPTDRSAFNQELKSLSLSILLLVIIYWVLVLFLTA